MAVFKCKMCGGTLEINNESVATCEYCGTQQTVPKVVDENLQNLFNRANTLRIKCEFDKAGEIYEKIIQADSTQAEAYWGLILCKYGIEYVDDPKTFKKIPTCHRASYDPIIADDDFKSAISNADSQQKAIYEQQANEIDRIQKEILALAQNEESYDVFICYKETDANGQRTQDSVIANDIYYQLTQEGFKVFYAAITLEGKLGSAYEPIIFAALNSAKVMLAIGTKPEHFNAVWVKNEWSRFLKIIKNDRSKLLIPCYRDMDAYELPEEFAHLQAQDMGKIGFVNDVVRGIKKVAGTNETKQSIQSATIINSEANGNITALLKRGYLSLEDGEWAKANDFFEQALNQNAELAVAYLGKLLADLKVKNQDSLKDCAVPFDANNNYQKAVRFADENLKATLVGYIEYINTRNENERLEGIYQNALKQYNDAQNFKTEQYFKDAANIFSTIKGYKDAEELYNKSLEEAETCRKNAIYNDAKHNSELKSIGVLKNCIEKFKSIPGWRDSDVQIVEIQKRIEELEKLKKEAEIAEEKRHRRNTIITASIIGIIALIIVVVILVNNVFIPNSKYNDAVTLMNEGKYDQAITEFKKLDGYKDSKNKINEVKYKKAESLFNAERYLEAINVLLDIEEYKDSKTKIKEAKYKRADVLLNDGKYTEAINALEELNGYKDSNSKINEIKKTYKYEMIKTAKVGDYIKFGTYEQDNNTANGKEDIEWLILEKIDNRIFVISKYALDCKPYNTTYTKVTWETCSLRKWLNSDFVQNNFDSEEKAHIPLVQVSADKNPSYSTYPGSATMDNVFILSITEVNKYFDSNSARECEATAYAVEKGAYVNSSNNNCCWWLRSPGYYRDYATYVYTYGAVSDFGSNVNYGHNAVRPAMWIEIG